MCVLVGRFGWVELKGWGWGVARESSSAPLWPDKDEQGEMGGAEGAREVRGEREEGGVK